MKKKARAKGKRTSSRSKPTPRRKTREKSAPPSPRRRRVPSIVRNIEDTEKALQVVRERVKPGSIKLGKTRYVTPTRAGFRALDKTLLGVQKAQRRKGAAFHLNLTIRFRDTRGKFVKVQAQGVGVPRLKDIRPRKGETRASAFRTAVEQQVMSAVFRRISAETIGYKERRQEAGARPTKRSAAQVRKELQRIKRTRQATFKVEVVRDVTPSKPTRPVPSRVRHGGRRKG